MASPIIQGESSPLTSYVMIVSPAPASDGSNIPFVTPSPVKVPPSVVVSGFNNVARSIVSPSTQVSGATIVPTIAWLGSASTVIVKSVDAPSVIHSESSASTSYVIGKVPAPANEGSKIKSSSSFVLTPVPVNVPPSVVVSGLIKSVRLMISPSTQVSATVKTPTMAGPAALTVISNSSELDPIIQAVPSLSSSTV